MSRLPKEPGQTGGPQGVSVQSEVVADATGEVASHRLSLDAEPEESELVADTEQIADHSMPLLWSQADAREEAEEGAKALSEERLRSVVESLLFVSDKPLTAARIHELLEEAAAAPREPSGPPVYQPSQILDVLSKIEVDYRSHGRGIELQQVAGGWQLRTAAQNAVWVQRLLQAKPVRLSRAQLETLSIVAYRQPITRPEIDDIRGVDSGGSLKTLLERQLVRILGKKEEPGRPLLYGTTREFLEFFNLRDLKDLPTLREYYDLSEEHKQKMKSLGHEPPVVPTPEAVVSEPESPTPLSPADGEAASDASAAGEQAADVDGTPVAVDVAAQIMRATTAQDGMVHQATSREWIDRQLEDDAEQLAKIDEMIRAVNTAFPLLDPTLLGMVADGTLPPPAATPQAGFLPTDSADDEGSDDSEADSASSVETADSDRADEREPEEL